MIGLAFSFAPADERWEPLQQTIHMIRTKLFYIVAELATPIGNKAGWPIEEEDVHFLGKEIDKMEKHLTALTTLFCRVEVQSVHHFIVLEPCSKSWT